MSTVTKDIGWSWAVPIGGFIANFIAGGFSKSFGIIVKSTKELFDTNAAPLTLAGGLIYTFAYCLTVIGVYITSKCGSRTSINIGGLGCVISFMCAFLSTTVTMWVISIGCGLGISLAFIYSPIFITVIKCFEKRSGIAMGITVAGVSVGQITFPTIVSYIIDQYGTRGVFLFACIVSTHFFLTAALMPRYIITQNQDEQTTSNENDDQTNKLHGDNSKNESSNMKEETPNTTKKFHKIHIIMLLLFVSARIFGDIGDVGIAFVLPLYGETELELSNQEISSAIAVSGGVDLVTRIVVGFVSDQAWCRRSLLLVAAWLLESINTILFLYFPSKTTYFIFYGLFGLSSGIAVTLMAVVLVDLVSERNLKVSFAIMMFVLGIVMSPGQFLVGYINDKTGNYIWSMKFLGINLFIAFLILSMEYPIKKLFFRKQDELDESDYELQRQFQLNLDKGDNVDLVPGLVYKPPSKIPKTQFATISILASINVREFLPRQGLFK